MNTYLLDEDDNYIILILNILKKLNADIKRKVFDLLIEEEITIELRQIGELVTQSWHELTISSIYELYSDYSD